MMTISINDYKSIADKIAARKQNNGTVLHITAWGMVEVTYRKNTPNLSDKWCDITNVRASMDDYPTYRLVGVDIDLRKLESMVLQSL